MLKELKASGQFRLFGLTNWSAETIDYAFTHFPFLHDDFEQVIVSGQEHLKKPEPLIFERLLRKTGIAARDSLFIDDSLPNVQTSRAMGIAAIHCKDYPSVKAEITKLTGFVFN